ncbi:hypothetical protein HWD03_gp058 [Alteromonas phage vB_AmeM_PT11-V22]|uniref:Uncharacterized protein n=1 Tax=Alteromonas phage vB_AmeM_PT11-V22 TaxID=2704031 RepID=A0A6C0R0V5_9CAUD|nr:hypothetical protein HWD03_gp058 [Alteromonas phage vB_AmeM_PT11-V22]QHZ59818.1 hypothetical protein [Alteromonas phage vB_AmeM_PT11-V22]
MENDILSLQQGLESDVQEFCKELTFLVQSSDITEEDLKDRALMIDMFRDYLVGG